MISLPADTFIAVFTGLQSGLSVGFQILKASTGSVQQARTIVGVVERPAGSGTYVVTGVAPSERGVYLIVIDWDNGNITANTSRSDKLEVSTTLAVTSSGLGPIADAAKSHMGETFDALAESEHYGTDFITRKIAVVKQRFMENPPSTADEEDLHELVIDYLGKLVALELMAPAIDYWKSRPTTVSTGNDPTETTSYTDPIKALEAIKETLLVQTRQEEATALSLTTTPRLRSTDDGPAIDELEDGLHVTADPRTFPSYQDYPTSRTTVIS